MSHTPQQRPARTAAARTATRHTQHEDAHAAADAGFADEEGDDTQQQQEEDDRTHTAAAASSSTAATSDADAVASAIIGPPAPSVAAAGFARWMCCFACVTFDLTLGPSLECMYPPGQLTPEEVTNVCSLSFPDSHCAVLGDSSFCFRMRMQTDRAAKLEAAAAAAAAAAAGDPARMRASSGSGGGVSSSTPFSAAAAAASAAAAAAGASLSNKHVRSHLKFLADNQSLMFGYVLFRQRRDDSNARGFFQKSIVLLSPLPAVEAFSQISAIVARAFFDFGPSVLEVAAQQVAAWPIPYPGRRITLPLLGESINQLQLPYYSPLSPMASAQSNFERQQQFAAGGATRASPVALAAPALRAGTAASASTSAASSSAFSFSSSAPSSPEPIVDPSGNGGGTGGIGEPSRSSRSSNDSANSSATNSRSASLSSSPVEHSTPAAAAAGSTLAVPTAAAAALEPNSAGVQGSDSQHHLNPLSKPALVHSVSDSTGNMARLARTTGSPPMHPRSNPSALSPLPASQSASNVAASMSPPASPTLNLTTSLFHPSLGAGVVHGSTAHGWFQSVPLYSAFSRSQVANLWYCWELVLSGEAILVVASSPSACSQVVLGLVSLISPIVYRGDYRPYFTIYDGDFKYYSQLHDLGKLSSAPVILGVTNPFFLKTMERFPNVICFGADSDGASGANAGAGATKAAGTIGEGVGYDSTESGSTGGERSPNNVSSSGGGSGGSTTTRISSKFNSAIDVLHIASAPSQFVSNSTPLLTPDEITLKRLRDIPSGNEARSGAAQAASSSGTSASSASGRDSAKPSVYSEEEQAALSGDHSFLLDINNALLRKYFQSLTHLFLSPFMPFVTFTPEQQKLYTERRWFPYSAPTNMPSIYGGGTPVGAAGSSPTLGPSSSPSSSSAAAVMGSSPSSKATPFALSASAAAAVAASSSSSAGNGHAPLNVPALPRFSEEDFLSRVIGNLTSAQLSLFPLSGLGVSQRRAKLQRLYEKFIRSVNFPPWFHEQKERANAQIGVLIAQEIQRLYRAGDAAFLRFMDGIKVAEALEMYKRATAMLEHTMHTPSFVTHNSSSSNDSAAAGSASSAAAAAVPGATSGSPSAVYTTDVHLQHAIQHHLQLMQSVIPQAQMAKCQCSTPQHKQRARCALRCLCDSCCSPPLSGVASCVVYCALSVLAWQSERHALLPDSKKKRLANSMPAPSPPTSSEGAAPLQSASPGPRGSPPLPSSSATGSAAARSPQQQPMQQRSSTPLRASPLPQATRAAPAAHPHPPHALADAARHRSASIGSFDSPSGPTPSSSNRRRHGASVVGLSSPELRTADIVVVQKQPLQMTISDDYF